MVKLTHLYWAERFVSPTVAFSMGFLVGMNYPRAQVIYWVGLILICAIAKVELHHWAEKLQKREEQQTSSGT